MQDLVSNHVLSYFKIVCSKKNQEILKQIEEYNWFCKDALISQKVYNIIHDIKEPPKCKNKNCFNHFQKPLKFHDISKGYYDFCCKKCSVNDENVINKRGDTMEERYGVRSARRCKEINDRAKKTTFERFGCECALSNKDIREKSNRTKMDRYGDEHYTNREKFKKTMDERYWSNPEGLKKVIEKTNKTSMDRYGVKFPMQCPEIWKTAIEHTFQTVKERYGVDKIYDIPGVA